MNWRTKRKICRNIPVTVTEPDWASFDLFINDKITLLTLTFLRFPQTSIRVTKSQSTVSPMYFYMRMSSLSREEQEKCCLHNFALIYSSNSILCTQRTLTDLSVVMTRKTFRFVFPFLDTFSSDLSWSPRLHLGEDQQPPGISLSSQEAQMSARPGSPAYLMFYEISELSLAEQQAVKSLKSNCFIDSYWICTFFTTLFESADRSINKCLTKYLN